MNQKISVLFVNDSLKEREFLLQEIQKEGFQVIGGHVTTKQDFEEVLQQRNWDIILGSTEVLSFNFTEQLTAANEYPEVPFILIVDEGDHECGISAMKSGARDYISRRDFQRLGPVVRRELASPSKKEEEDLIKTNNRQSALIDYLCHEVRASISSITASNKLLAQNKYSNLTDEELQYTEGINISGHSILRLVNNVLEFSKARSGKREPQIEPVNIHSFCQKIQQVFLPLANEKGISFAVENNISGLTFVHTDLLYLEQIVRNLISNAIKFTHQGEVRIEAFIVNPSNKEDKDIKSKEAIAFRIKDSGIGISKDKQKIIFESFKQADHSIQKNFGGTGLGLSICQKNLELLGGDLELKSKKGSGSCFTAYLPLRNRCTGQTTALKDKSSIHNNSTKNGQFTHPMTSKPELSKSSVLLVDDSQMHTSALKELLNPYLTTCKTAGTAQEAYRLLDTHSFDFIITDMNLPDATGHEIIEYINSYPPKNCNIIVYTGRNLSREEESHLKSETYSLIYKSVDSYKQIINVIT